MNWHVLHSRAEKGTGFQARVRHGMMQRPYLRCSSALASMATTLASALSCRQGEPHSIAGTNSNTFALRPLQAPQFLSPAELSLVTLEEELSTLRSLHPATEACDLSCTCSTSYGIGTGVLLHLPCGGHIALHCLLCALHPA